MGDVEEVQEQMKVDMVALKDQMASMMEAMLSIGECGTCEKKLSKTQ